MLFRLPRTRRATQLPLLYDADVARHVADIDATWRALAKCRRAMPRYQLTIAGAYAKLMREAHAPMLRRYASRRRHAPRRSNAFLFVFRAICMLLMLAIHHALFTRRAAYARRSCCSAAARRLLPPDASTRRRCDRAYTAACCAVTPALPYVATRAVLPAC